MSARVLAGLTAALIMVTLAPVWWWALIGMSEQVGTAWVVTIVFAWLVMAAAATNGLDDPGGDR